MSNTAPTRPDYLPEAFFDATTGIKHKEFGDHYKQLTTQLAAEEVRRNALPKAASDYKMDLPKDFQLPTGMQWQWKTDAPEFGKFREAALKHGLSQDAVTDLAGIYAGMQVGEAANFEALKRADMEKLGANSAARITALETFFAGVLGADDAKAVKMGLYSSGMVTAMEKLVAKFATQGHGSFSQHGREPGKPGRVSEEEYNRMTPAQRWDYSRSFDQKQFNGAGR